MKKYSKLWAVLLTICILCGLFSGCSNSAGGGASPLELARSLLESVQVTALEDSEAGVSVTSSFALSCDRALDEEQLESMLRVSPPAPYELTKQGAGSYLLQFKDPLLDGTVYSIMVESSPFDLSRSFVFQTERIFGVTSTNPSRSETYVALDTGIEVTFSAADVDMQPYFSITPQVPGHFETYNYTCVFVPAQPLALDTQYSVRISGDLQSPAGEPLGADYTFTFSTTDYDPAAGYVSRPYVSLAQDASETFLPDDPVVIEFYAYDMEPEYHVDLYRYPSQEAYMQALQDYDEYVRERGTGIGYEIPSAALTLAYDFDTPGESAGQEYSYYSKNIVLPEHPGSGYYLANVRLTGTDGERHQLQKLIQISDVSVYTQSLNGETLFWLNSTSTGNALSDATIRLYTGFDDPSPYEIRTGPDGIAVTDLLADEHRFFTVDVLGVTRFVDRNPLTAYTSIPASQMYFSVLYKDREVYQPSDTMHIWGVLRQRRDAYELPAYVQARLYQGYSWYSYYSDVTADGPALYTGEAVLSADGSYTTEINHANLASGNYYIALTTPDGAVVDVSQLLISDYVKPDYIVKTELDRLYYTLDDDIRLDTEVSFYDGTAAHDMRLFAGETWYYDKPENGLYATTDQQGQASFNLGRQSFPYDSWYPYYASYRVESADAQTAPANAYVHAAILPRDVMMDARYTAGETSGTVEITANYIDTGTITSTSQIFENNYENIRGAPADLPVRIELTRTRYVRDEVQSSYYDFINRQTIYRYSYRSETDVLDARTVRTSGGSLVLTDLPVADAVNSYQLSVVMQDTRGREIRVERYLYSMGGTGGDPNYRLYFETGREWNDTAYKLGDAISLRVDSYGRDFDMTGGRTLYTIYQNQVVEHGVVSGSDLTVAYTEEMIPNVGIAGAFYSGRHVYKVEDYYGNGASFDYADRALEVDITTDKDKYRPGERAAVTVRVTDPAGLPVPGSSVCVGVVDEAIFAIRAQNVQPLNQLYRSAFPTNRIQTYVSYIQHLPWGDGGKGGGGGDEDTADTREKFEDTAAFHADQTGADGTVTFSFIVPDNLTSWRLTAVAVDGELRAGTLVDNVTSSLPYFVQPTVNARFLEGEDVVFTAKIFGENAGPSTVEVSVNGGEITRQASVNWENYAEFNFGKLPAGVYDVQLDASGGGYSDSVRHSFQVVDSLMELPVSEEVNLTGNLPLTSLRYPVTLAVYDAQYAGLMECIARLGTYNPVRLDQKVGLAVVQDAVARYAVDGVWPGFLDVDVDLSNLQYDDPAQTAQIARACIAAPDTLPRGTVISFLYGRLSDPTSSEEMVAAAYMGLAALREPVLLDVRMKLKATDDETEALYYLVALAALGDTQNAGSEYTDRVSRHLQTRGTQTWLDYTGSAPADLIYLRTSLACLASLLLDEDDAALSMLRYLDQVGSDRYTCLLESAAYVARFKPDASAGDCRLRYTAGGEQHTVDLTQGGVKYLRFSREALASARFEQLSGSIGGRVFYTAGPDAFSSAGERYATITKTVDDPGPLQMGDLAKFTVNIHFADDAPEGWYQLTDFLPSSMRFLSGAANSVFYYDFWNSRYFREKDQRLGLCIYISNNREYPSPRDYEFHYFGRVMYTGEYIAESAYLVHEEDLVSLRTPRFTAG